ncbi:amino acid permease [Clostridium sp. WILCCON 0269]|uniref:Amino acid permease n=1 Tax=Candidatus Clostridium eludens TaxID=3381663 RepID=A0ABW8SWH8_9CLOT
MKKKDYININNGAPRNGLNAYSLAGIGIGGMIGAGFFLGSSLAVTQAGPSIIIAFLLGGIIMSQVLGAMTSISINRPVQGSFRVYTEQFLGKFIGFVLGWVVFTSGILTLSSEAIASGVFLKYWMPNISSTIFALSTLIITVGINGLGTKYFGYIESVMAIVKIAILIIFIVLGGIFIIKNGITITPSPFASYNSFFPNNISGFLQSMLIVIFTYAGISAVAMAAAEVNRPCVEIPKATVIMTLGVIILYVISMFIIVSTVKWNLMNTNISPFVQSFNKMGYKWASTLTNAVILIATLSVMSGTYYSCVQILVSLSSASESPKIFKNTTQRGFYRNAWIATGLLPLLVVLISFVLGTKLFNYLISSSSYFSFFNWIINLITYIIWLKKRSEKEIYNSPLIKGRLGTIITIIVILVLLVISLRVSDFRIGFYVSLAVLASICISYKLLKRYVKAN